jgi:predicted ATPase/DNA-binding CsgD family transcriptional regulator
MLPDMSDFVSSARSRSVGRLPAEVTSFVGRRGEIARIRQLVFETRLLTLTGVGGCGKTRLAIEVAHQSRRMFADGVWFVDLAGLSDDSLLEFQVALSLSVPDRSDQDIADIVLEYLSRRELLLVLDNCEHMLDSCARFVDQALRSAGGLQVLCTSRQPLGILGEQVFTVPPLPVPPTEQPLSGEAGSNYPALTLFVDRATAAAPGFVMTEDNQADVVEICRRLDGLPLAIELAAARMRTLSIRQLAAGLRDRSWLLSVRHATPRHHRTLEETFDWSFALCSPAERLLWARASVFADGFELTAAEAVCGGEGLPADTVLEVLAGLVDKSVLIREVEAGHVRYRLLETLRQHGLDQLRACGGGSALDEDALRRRHRDWYLLLAERFDADWFGPRQPDWTRRMRAQHANLQAALSYCLANPDETRAAVRLAGLLSYFWWACGVVHEGQYWLERVLAADPHPSRDRLGALAASSRLLRVQGEHAAAAARAKQCLQQAKQLNDELFVARATADLGVSLMLGGDSAAAQPLLEDALARLSQLGEVDPTVVVAKLALAMAVLVQGDPVRAGELCAECRAFCRTRGDQWWLGHVLTASSYAVGTPGDAECATAYARESLRVRRDLNDPLGDGGGLERLAWLAAGAHDYPRAARLLGAAMRQWRIAGQVVYSAPWWMKGHLECEATTRQALGDAGFATEFRRGADLPRVQAIAYAVGDGPASADRTASRDTDETLTPREREVAQLIGQGLINREIAAKLGIARRTAESHVENILRKLGFATRTQVAIWILHGADRPK